MTPEPLDTGSWIATTAALRQLDLLLSDRKREIMSLARKSAIAAGRVTKYGIPVIEPFDICWAWNHIQETAVKDAEGQG
jgi:hypothetical protein